MEEKFLPYSRKTRRRLWRTVESGWSSLRAKYLHSSAARWEALYQQGYAAKLSSSEQRPRNYVVTGILDDLAARRSHVLDVGCGIGTTLSMLSSSQRSYQGHYLGIDLSTEAIAACRRRYGYLPSARFEVAAFGDFQSTETFDAVVLNEVLYYFPLRQVRSLVEKAAGLLKNERSLLIISMSRCPKAALVWLRCGFLPEPAQRISVAGKGLGNSWTVQAYRFLDKKQGRISPMTLEEGSLPCPNPRR